MFEAFVRTVEAESFTAAAQQLGLAKSAVSRRISELERHLGTQLLQRTTRRLALTEAGQMLYDRAVRLLADWEDAETTVRDQKAALTGRIRMAAPMSFSMAFLSDALIAFMDHHPGILFDIDFSDRKADLIAEGIDLALRIGDLPDSSLMARRLAPIETFVVASPAYLAAHGTPQTPAELIPHPELAYTHRPNRRWRYKGPGGETGEIELPISVRATNGDFLRKAALAGKGILIEPDFILCDDVRSGRLVPLLQDYVWADLSLYAVYPPTRHLPLRIRVLIDFLLEQFGRSPPWRLSGPSGNA